MGFEDVMQHYGFLPDTSAIDYSPISSYVHPTVTGVEGRNCSVLIFGSRAIVSCPYGTPIYSVSPHDVEFLLRREFSHFSLLPAIGEA